MIKAIYENEELKEYYENNPLFHKVIREITQDQTDSTVVLVIKSLCEQIENRTLLSEEEIRQLRTGLALMHANRMYAIKKEAESGDKMPQQSYDLGTIHSLDVRLYARLIQLEERGAKSDEEK